MIDAARRRDVFVMEALWSRFLPSYRTLTEVVTGGRIGDVLQVDADFGFRLPFDPQHRLFAPDLGGGALLDLGIYPLQLALLLLGPIAQIAAVAELGETGVDERMAAVLRHERGGLAVIKASMTTGLACTARISGTEGWIDLPAFMHCPQSLTVHTLGESDTIDCAFDGDGLEFEIEEVHRCLQAGLTESPLMPVSETLALSTAMDDIRAQTAVRYSADD